MWCGRVRVRFRSILSVLALALGVAILPLGSEPVTGVRVLPAYYYPLNDPVFQPGAGAALVLDYYLVPNVSLFAQGEIARVGLENVTGFSLRDASVGAGVLRPVRDRFTLRGDLMAGVYSSEYRDVAVSGISGGVRVSALYRISPSVSASIASAYRHFANTPAPFMRSLTFGIGVDVNLREAMRPQSRIRVRADSFEPVFPVLYSWYDANRFGTVTVTNNETTAITNVRVAFFLERYMSQPRVTATVARLEAGESIDVPITALFNERMLELGESISTQAQVIVTYRRLGSSRRATLPVPVSVLHRNAMTWTDDRRAAAFVSPRDPAALWFSKYVGGIVGDRFRPGVNRNLQYAMGVFDALKVYGINYVVDPNSAYVDFIDDPSSIDFLQYPFETLIYRGGDCDDLSILFSALLEALGIETAFITVPGHIYIAFDSGMSEVEARRDFFDPDLLVYQDGHAWVPLETTLIREEFNRAWIIGARQWEQASARGEAEFFRMSRSWELYRPVSVPGAVPRFHLPEYERTVAAYDATVNAFVQQAIGPRIEEYQGMLARENDVRVRNRLGVLLARYGLVDAGREHLRIAADAANTDAAATDAWINLGNTFFLEQRYEDALSHYAFALSREPANSHALLGAARCYYELSRFQSTDALFRELSRRDPHLAREYGYLGSFYDTRGRAWSLSERLATVAWSDTPPPPATPALAEPVSQPPPATPAAAERPSTVTPAAPVITEPATPAVAAPEPIAATTPTAPPPAVAAPAEAPDGEAPRVAALPAPPPDPDPQPASSPQPPPAPPPSPLPPPPPAPEPERGGLGAMLGIREEETGTDIARQLAEAAGRIASAPQPMEEPSVVASSPIEPTPPAIDPPPVSEPAPPAVPTPESAPEIAAPPSEEPVSSAAPIATPRTEPAAAPPVVTTVPPRLAVAVPAPVPAEKRPSPPAVDARVPELPPPTELPSPPEPQPAVPASPVAAPEPAGKAVARRTVGHVLIPVGTLAAVLGLAYGVRMSRRPRRAQTHDGHKESETSAGS